MSHKHTGVEQTMCAAAGQWLGVLACLAGLTACRNSPPSTDAGGEPYDGGEEFLPADDSWNGPEENSDTIDGEDADGSDTADADGPDGGSADGGGETPADIGLPDAADAAGDGEPGSWRESLSVCWLDPACHQALVVSHGGDWNVSDAPFLSRAAFEKAYAAGADGIELDVRVTADGVAVVAHSSPIEFYESVDCAGKTIEQMTADEVTRCHLAPSLTQTFQRLDDVLAWAQGKFIIEMDVKETSTLATAMATVAAAGASDRAFFLVSVGEILSDIPQIPGWERFHYMVNISDPSQVDVVLPLAGERKIFLFEMDRSYSSLDQAGMARLISEKIVPGGVKAFCASDKTYVTVQVHLDMYRQGFDVVLSYSLANGLEAARQINQERGYPP